MRERVRRHDSLRPHSRSPSRQLDRRSTRRGARAAESARLESVCGATHRGFESHSLRHVQIHWTENAPGAHARSSESVGARTVRSPGVGGTPLLGVGVRGRGRRPGRAARPGVAGRPAGGRRRPRGHRAPHGGRARPAPAPPGASRPDRRVVPHRRRDPGRAHLRQVVPRRGARASTATSRGRPTWSPSRPTRRRSSPLLDWCGDARVAAIPYGGGSSVVGGVERADGDDTAAGGQHRPQPARPRARGRPHVARRAHPGRRAGTGARGAAAAARSHPAPLPAVVRVLDASAGGWPPARAATSPRSTPTSTTWSSRCGSSPRAGRARRGGCPDRARGRRPTGSSSAPRASLGVITEAWMRLQDRPRFRASAAVRFADFGGRCRRRPGDRPVGAVPGELPAARRRRGALTGAGTRRRTLCSCSRFESADHPRRAVDGAGRRAGADHGGTSTCRRAAEPAAAASDADAIGRRRRLARRFLRAPYPRDALVRRGHASSRPSRRPCTWDRFAAFMRLDPGDAPREALRSAVRRPES